MAAELLGCGIDAEDPRRFRPGSDPWSWRDVFSARELEHARAQDDGSRALAASFGAKEALFKALGTAFDPVDCELCHQPGRTDQVLGLSAALRRDHRVADARAQVTFSPDGECRVLVFLFGAAPPVA